MAGAFLFALALVSGACGLESTTIGAVNQGAADGATDGTYDALPGDLDGAALGDATALDSSAGADSAACVVPSYPGGPYGVAQGQTVPPTPKWQGYVGGSNVASTLSPTDYFDPAFCRGSHALYIVEIDASDPTAVTATQDIANALAGPWSGAVVKALLLVTRNAQGGAATVADAQAWQQTYGVTWDIAVDAAETFQDASGFFPQIRVVVDTCTMQIKRWVHRDDVSSDVSALANRATCP